MHLPTGTTALYHSGQTTAAGGGSNASVPGAAPAASATDWSLSPYKSGGGSGSSGGGGGSVLDAPSSSGSSNSPSGTQELWWTERFVIEAQQEFPNELGNRIFFSLAFSLFLIKSKLKNKFNLSIIS